MLSHYRRDIFDIFTIIFEAAAKKAILEDLDQTLYKKIWFRILTNICGAFFITQGCQWCFSS